LEDTGTTLPATLVSMAGNITTIDGVVDAILADTGTDGVVVATASKTGYSLAATGLDSISATAVASPTTWPQRIMWALQRFYNSAKTPTTLTTKTDAGETLTTQTITDDGAGTETLGAPS
jgi:hypothetical protein